MVDGEKVITFRKSLSFSVILLFSFYKNNYFIKNLLIAPANFSSSVSVSIWI